MSQLRDHSSHLMVDNKEGGLEGGGVRGWVTSCIKESVKGRKCWSSGTVEG